MKFLRLGQSKIKQPQSEAERLSEYRDTGNVALLGTLYEPYLDMVYLICMKYLKDEDDSKDAVMQIFEKLVVDLRNHRVEHFKSWLHSLVRNHCLMKIRSRHVFVEIGEMTDSDEFIDAEGSPLEQAMFLDGQLNALSKCLDALTTEQRVSVELFYKQEKCYKDIAGETGFEINKVKSYIQNGKRNLKICMDRNGNN